MYLGLDLGTSGLKAVLIDNDGKLLAQESASLTVQTPQKNWSEQDPETWWNACCQIVGELRQKVDLTSLRGVGLSGQMHGATLIDEKGEVLRPCILWNDGRSEQECLEFESACPDSRELSGNLAMPGFTAPKILWVKKHEPDIYRAIDKVLLPKDYLRYRLTGEMATDMSDAAGTLWLNPKTRDWDDALLSATGLTREHMPTLYEGTGQTGCLTSTVAEELGLPQVPVFAGGGDNAAGAVGMGITEPGQGLISLGTSGVMFVVSEDHRASPENTVHAFCHALPDRCHQMGVTLGAASSLEWWSTITGKPVPELLKRLELSNMNKTKVLFLPYLSGERTPHNNADASGQFFGLRRSTTEEEMTLAILEGVAFSLLDCRDALLHAGSSIQTLSLIGGGAKSEQWRQILADCLQQSVSLKDGGDVGPGLGAARLALIGDKLGQGESLSELLKTYCQEPQTKQNHEPRVELNDYYQAKLSVYRELYQQTNSASRQLMNLPV